MLVLEQHTTELGADDVFAIIVARVDRLHIVDLLWAHHLINALVEVNVVLCALDVWVAHLVASLHHLSDQRTVFDGMDHLLAHHFHHLSWRPVGGFQWIDLDVSTTLLVIILTDNVVS